MVPHSLAHSRWVGVLHAAVGLLAEACHAWSQLPFHSHVTQGSLSLQKTKRLLVRKLEIMKVAVTKVWGLPYYGCGKETVKPLFFNQQYDICYVAGDTENGSPLKRKKLQKQAHLSQWVQRERKCFLPRTRDVVIYQASSWQSLAWIAALMTCPRLCHLRPEHGTAMTEIPSDLSDALFSRCLGLLKKLAMRPFVTSDSGTLTF